MKTSDDRLVAAWAVATAGALVNVPVLLFLGLPDGSVTRWLVMSAALHVAYGYALAGAYDRVRRFDSQRDFCWVAQRRPVPTC